MKNNMLYAGLALSLCMTAIPISAHPEETAAQRATFAALLATAQRAQDELQAHLAESSAVLCSRHALENPDYLTRMLRHGAGANDRHPIDNETPLIRSVVYGFSHAMHILTERGAAPPTHQDCERAKRINLSLSDHQLESLQQVSKKISFKRKTAIKEALDRVTVAQRTIQDGTKSMPILPRSVRNIVTSMSEHPDTLTWWQQADRLRVIACLRLPDELLEYVLTFDSPQDINAYRELDHRNLETA